jgi:hypothetical protein
MANWLDKYNDDIPNAQNGIEGTMGGLTDQGFNYNGAWGGTMQMGGSLPGSVGHMYARTISPAPSNGKYAKKTKASAQTGEAIVKSDTGGGAPDDGYIKLDPTKFSLTTTRGVSEAFDPTNSKWTGQSTEWLQKRISNAELLVQAIKDARSLSKNEWQEKYKGASFAAVGEGRAQPILPDFYNDYKKRDDAFIQDWSQARDQAKNELLMQSRWTANKEKAKKEALDFLGQYKNQNEFLSNIPTQSAEKYGYTPGELENVSPWQFLSKDAVSKAYYAINANKGFPLPQDPTNEMTCANGVCTLESMIGVDFSPLKGKKGVYYDPETGYTIPQYNPTWLENENYKKVGYRKLDNLNELPQPGDIVQYSDEKGVPGHMELVLENLPNGIVVYNNYSQTNDYRPGEGKEVRGYKPGTYQQLATDNFAQTNYFRLTPEAQQKALSRNPTYLKKVEGKKAFESSEDYKKFMEAQEYTKANQEKYNKFNQLNPQDWRNGGRTSAQNGQEMRFYQEGLDWKPKNISKDGGWLSKYEEGGIIEDPMGQWAHPGEITRIPSNQITMQGVDYPVLGISDTGDTKMMQPGEDYKFKGKSVTEIPMAQDGITRGGYDDPDYVTGTSRRAFNKMVGMGNYLVPANAINSAADLAKAKGLDYGAITSGPADAVRHAAAAASVASRLPVPKFIGQYSPDLDRAIRIAGANLLGIGNEIMSPNSEGLWMDIKNNYQGSLIGSIRGLNQNDRNKMILNQLQKNKLTVDNPKKPKKENGGWLNKYK